MEAGVPGRSAISNLPIGSHGLQSECGACGLIFCGVEAFERHRVGQHGVNRRCLTVNQMTAKNFTRCEFDRWRA